MSETIRSSDAPRTMSETAARTAQAAADVANQTMKDTASATKSMTEEASEQMKQAASTAETAYDKSEKMADAAANVSRVGLNASADVGSRMADMGYDRGRRLLASTAQAIDVYSDARERSAERVQAMMASAFTLTRGIQKMQHAWFEFLDGSVDRAVHRPQHLLRCKSLTELAEVQCELYTDAINHAFKSSSRMLELAGQTAQEAIRPLQAGMH